MSELDHPVGTTLRGGYRVINVLRGGMGVVYICHQEATDQLYAVKTVRFDGAESDVEVRLARFGSEVNHWIRISRESRCDRIVTALAFDADERLLILEFVDGLPISGLVRKGRPVHPRHWLDWARDIAVGMRELHAAFRLIHRDLKPANVLVSRKDLTAKVTDLGIGKVLRPEDGTHTLIGTPKFMAPECFHGRADFRSDIWAYGATLHWMATLEHATPLDGPIESGRPLPPPVVRLLEKCLQRDPEARWQTFDEILASLDSIVDLSEFPVDEGEYAFCEVHRFHSPRPLSDDPEEEPCLFCAQARRLDEQITWRGTAATDDSQPSAEASSASAADESATRSVFLRGALGKEQRIEVLPGSEPTRVPWHRRRGVRLGFAALLLVGLAAAGWGFFEWWRGRQPVRRDLGGQAESRGTGGDTHRMGRVGENGVGENGGTVAATGHCHIAGGCEHAAASTDAYEAYRDKYRARNGGRDLPDWKPHLCEEHSPVVCQQCSRRYPDDRELLKSGDERCDSCGGSDFEVEAPADP